MISKPPKKPTTDLSSNRYDVNANASLDESNNQGRFLTFFKAIFGLVGDVFGTHALNNDPPKGVKGVFTTCVK